MATNFEIYGIDPPIITATLDATVIDPTSSNPTNVLDHTLAFQVKVDWELQSPSLLANAYGTGTWNVDVFLDSYIPGASNLSAVNAGIAMITTTPHVNGPYTSTVTVAPGAAGPLVGAYRLLVTVTHMSPGGTPDGMAGFYEGPIIQFF